MKQHTKLEFFTPGILHPVTTQTLPTDTRNDIELYLTTLELGAGLLSKRWFYPWHSISRVRITHFPAPPQTEQEAKEQISSVLDECQAAVTELKEAIQESSPVDPIVPGRSEPDHRLGAVEHADPVEIMHNEGNPNHPLEPQTVPGDPIEIEIEDHSGIPEPEPEEQVEIITRPEDEEALDRIFGPRHD